MRKHSIHRPPFMVTYHGVNIALVESEWPGCMELVVQGFNGRGQTDPVKLEIVLTEHNLDELETLVTTRGRFVRLTEDEERGLRSVNEILEHAEKVRGRLPFVERALEWVRARIDARMRVG